MYAIIKAELGRDTMSLPTVALVGRPNVGKSTLFNKIVAKKISIIEDTPGVTRDRIYQEAIYNQKKFYLVDTGGIDTSNEKFNDEIKMQAEIAIKEADIVIFMVDGKEGLTSNDLIIKEILRKSQKKVIVAINKMDVKEAENNIYDFYELGFDTYIPISSIHNIGYIELMDTVTNDFKEKEDQEDNRLRFSIIGRPNVGKSSLMNALLNEERVVVSDIAGTTRDSIDSVLKYHNEEYILVDTAGMRKKGKVFESIEKYSLFRSLKSIDNSDICLVVINAEEGITEHDKHIAGYAIEKGKGLIFVVNKWDTVKNTTIQEFEKLMRAEFQFATYAPIVYLSALTKKRIHTLMPEVIKVAENIKKEIKTSLINEVILDAYQLNIPPSYKGKRLKIYFTSQTGTKPPKFTFRVNSKGLVHFSYERYLENKIRENFDFTGTPIVLQFKNRNDEN
jgi:GTPase